MKGLAFSVMCVCVFLAIVVYFFPYWRPAKREYVSTDLLLQADLNNDGNADIFDIIMALEAQRIGSHVSWVSYTFITVTTYPFRNIAYIIGLLGFLFPLMMVLADKANRRELSYLLLSILCMLLLVLFSVIASCFSTPHGSIIHAR